MNNATQLKFEKFTKKKSLKGKFSKSSVDFEIIQLLKIGKNSKVYKVKGKFLRNFIGPHKKLYALKVYEKYNIYNTGMLWHFEVEVS